jgi:hypothetical protein
MAVGVLAVAGLRDDLGGDERADGDDDVDGGIDAVADDGQRAGEEADDDLGDGEHRVAVEGDERGLMDDGGAPVHEEAKGRRRPVSRASRRWGGAWAAKCPE